MWGCECECVLFLRLKKIFRYFVTFESYFELERRICFFFLYIFSLQLRVHHTHNFLAYNRKPSNMSQVVFNAKWKLVLEENMPIRITSKCTYITPCGRLHYMDKKTRKVLALVVIFWCTQPPTIDDRPWMVKIFVNRKRGCEYQKGKKTETEWLEWKVECGCGSKLYRIQFWPEDEK